MAVERPQLVNWKLLASFYFGQQSDRADRSVANSLLAVFLCTGRPCLVLTQRSANATWLTTAPLFALWTRERGQLWRPSAKSLNCQHTQRRTLGSKKIIQSIEFFTITDNFILKYDDRISFDLEIRASRNSRRDLSSVRRHRTAPQFQVAIDRVSQKRERRKVGHPGWFSIPLVPPLSTDCV